MNQSAKFANLFGCGMVFQQNKSVSLYGFGIPNEELEISILKDASVLQTQKTIVDKSGRWQVCFDGYKASYEQYEITLSQNGEIRETLSNIVFGELWLASGQSNMEFKMWETPEGDEMLDAPGSVFPNEHVRILFTPTTYSWERFYEPQEDIPEARWVVCDSPATHNISAVAFWFAHTLQQALDIPIGVLDAALGGTPIETWMSRESIEENDEIKHLLIEENKYVGKEEWNNECEHTTMTTCYNNKIDMLRIFNITGIIWYQGETNIEYQKDFYTKALNVLVADWSQKFGFEDSSIPFVFAHIAPYAYNPQMRLPEFWEEMAAVWNMHKDTMAQLPIYDVPLDYDYSAWANWGTGGHPIHPYTKKPVGVRFGLAALGLVYHELVDYTSPVMISSDCKDGAVYIKFNHVADGLVSSDGQMLRGFSVCGEDEIYVNAQAEIIKKDIVKVWSTQVNNPVAVTYAFHRINTSSNLASKINGQIAFMAVPFRTAELSHACYMENLAWMNTAEEKAWHCIEATPYLYDTWKTVGKAECSMTESGLEDGNRYMEISYSGKEFAVSPVFYSPEGRLFRDQPVDFSLYKTISFKVKSDKDDVEFQGVRFKDHLGNWYVSQVHQERKHIGNRWEEVIVNLNELRGEETERSYSASVLNDLREVQFCFKAIADLGKIYIDKFCFGT